MKPRAFHLHPGEPPAAAIGRLYRHVQQMRPDYHPQSQYAARQQMKKQRHLRLVKG